MACRKKLKFSSGFNDEASDTRTDPEYLPVSEEELTSEPEIEVSVAWQYITLEYSM